MFSLYKDILNILAGVSLRKYGNMKLTGTAQDAVVHENRRRFCALHDIPYERLVGAQLVHGKEVAIVDGPQDDLIHQTDALVTREKNLYISVTVADCFPVFFYDATEGVIGVAHAGWRGVVAGIIPRTIEKMMTLGTKPENIHIEIGPGISQENFDFSFSEMTKEFGHFAQDKYIAPGSTMDKVKIDLQKMIHDQIVGVGGRPEHIGMCDVCTFGDEAFFSARRHEGVSDQAMLALIGMRS